MSSTRPRIPSYRHHKASGQAFVQIKGKRHYLGKYGSHESKEKYNRIVAELCVRPPAEALAAKSPVERVAGMSVVELIQQYFEFATAYYRKDGQSTGTAERLRPVLSVVVQTYGRTPAADFGPLALKAIRQQLIDKGHSRTYVNMNTARLKRVFRWAVSEQLVPPSVYQALAAVPGLRKGRSAARETQPVGAVDDATVRATLDHLPPVVADMVQFQRLTGCRPAEVRLIRPRDVDRSVDPWVYRPASHKTQHHERDRAVFIGPKAQAILRPYLLRDADAHCFSPAESVAKQRAQRHEKRKTPMSCGNRPGKGRKPHPAWVAQCVYTKDAYNRAITRACDKAGIPRWAPNRLRHAAATEIRRRYGLEASQVVLGHAHAAVTEVYAERDMALAARIAREVG